MDESNKLITRSRSVKIKAPNSGLTETDKIEVGVENEPLNWKRIYSDRVLQKSLRKLETNSDELRKKLFFFSSHFNDSALAFSDDIRFVRDKYKNALTSGYDDIITLLNTVENIQFELRNNLKIIKTEIIDEFDEKYDDMFRRINMAEIINNKNKELEIKREESKKFIKKYMIDAKPSTSKGKINNQSKKQQFHIEPASSSKKTAGGKNKINSECSTSKMGLIQNSSSGESRFHGLHTPPQFSSLESLSEIDSPPESDFVDPRVCNLRNRELELRMVLQQGLEEVRRNCRELLGTIRNPPLIKTQETQESCKKRPQPKNTTRKKRRKKRCNGMAVILRNKRL